MTDAVRTNSLDHCAPIETNQHRPIEHLVVARSVERTLMPATRILVVDTNPAFRDHPKHRLSNKPLEHFHHGTVGYAAK